MKKVSFAFCVFFQCLLLLPLFAAAAPNDYDQDGVSDVYLVEILPSSLEWSAALASQSFVNAGQIGSLGENGNMLSPGSWSQANTQEIGVCAYSQNSDVVTWTIINSNAQSSAIQHGAGGDLIVSGGDYDGNGISDAAAIKSSGAVSLKLNPFAGGSASDLSLTLPAGSVKKGKGIFLKRSTEDQIGALRRIAKGRRQLYALILISRDGVIFKKNFPTEANWSLVDAVPVEGADGKDNLLIYEKNKSKRRVSVFSLSGSRRYRKSAVNGTLMVGNFLSAPGEEFAIYYSGNLRVINPFSKNSNLFTGLADAVPADQVNVGKFASSGGGSSDPVSGCSSTKSFPSTHIYKTVGSSHFTDVRRNTIGLILKNGASGPFPSCISVLDIDGNELGKMGLYQRGNGWAARYYAGIGCGSSSAFNGSAFAAKAVKNTGSPNILFSFEGQCLGPIDARVCVGSGQC